MSQLVALHWSANKKWCNQNRWNKRNYIGVPKDTPLKQSLGLPWNLGVYKLWIRSVCHLCLGTVFGKIFLSISMCVRFVKLSQNRPDFEKKTKPWPRSRDSNTIFTPEFIRNTLFFAESNLSSWMDRGFLLFVLWWIFNEKVARLTHLFPWMLDEKD